MEDLSTLKDSLVQYIMQTEDRHCLMELFERVDSAQRSKRIGKIALEISKELDCSDSMAEYIGQWHEEIYKIISKSITYEGVKVSPEKEIR